MGSKYLNIPQWVELDGDDDSLESSLFKKGDILLVAIAVRKIKLKKWVWDIHKIEYKGKRLGFLNMETGEKWTHSFGDVQYFMRLNNDCTKT